MKSDLEIAQAATLKHVIPLAYAKIGIEAEALSPVGHFKAKLSQDYIRSLKGAHGRLSAGSEAKIGPVPRLG